MKKKGGLGVETIQKSSLVRYIPEFWRMNICACSETHFFVANKKSIDVFKLRKHDFQIDTSKPVHEIETEQTIHYIRCVSVKTGEDSEEMYLMAVGKHGMVEIRQISSPDNTFTKLSNNDESTWSCGMTSKYILAGSNGHYISKWRRRDWKESRLEGSRHNIPCVDVSSDGHFVGGACIDRRVRIWNIHTGQLLSEREACRNEWGWAIRFISREWMRVLPDGDVAEGKEGPGLVPGGFNWKRPERDLEMLSNARFRAHVDGDQDLYLDDDDDDDGDGESEGEDGLAFDEDQGQEGEGGGPRDDESERLLSSGESSSEVVTLVDVGVFVDETENDGDTEMKDKKQSMAEEEEEEEDLKEYANVEQTEFVVFTSKFHIYLFSPKLELLDSIYYNPNTILRFLHPNLLGLRRLSILEFVPEFSLFAVASQASNRVLLVSVNRNPRATKFRLREEMVIERSEIIWPISGVCCSRVRKLENCRAFVLFVVHLDKSFASYEITQRGGRGAKLSVKNVVL